MRGILAAHRRACETSESSGSSSSEESDSQPEASSPDSSTDSGASDSSSNDSEQERQRVVALKRRDQTAKARAALATTRFQEMKQRCEPRLQRLAGCQSFNRRYSPQSSMLKTGGECRAESACVESTVTSKLLQGLYLHSFEESYSTS